MRSPGPLVIGHRGAPGYRPEHTASSYALALELGVDAVEPDVVVSADGVLVVRHENEISGTTDVAERPEFADRRRTTTIDGASVTGWFAEDFTWAELSTLRCRERLPRLRPASASFDGQQGILRLSDVVDLVRSAARDQRRRIGLVVEVKHASHLRAHGHDLIPLLVPALQGLGAEHPETPLTIESFEPTALDRLREAGVDARFVFLLEAAGRPADLVAALGERAPTTSELIDTASLASLAERFDGISVDKKLLLDPGLLGHARGPGRLVDDAHEHGLSVFTWTCRPENAFLIPQFRRGAGRAPFGDYAGEWGLLRESGIDGVFVDHPDLGRDVFG